MISVLIPTKDEEQDLPGCLESVAWSDDVHVYDSYSTDGTARVAEAAGATVWRRPQQNTAAYFGGDEAEHKNWALRNIRFKYDWVFHVDADERVTPPLAAELRRAAENPGDFVAFRARRRDFFLGRELKHVQASPFFVRLFRHERMRYERKINPVCVADGRVGDAGGWLDHYPFSKGMRHWFDRHNWYSTLEAAQIVANRAAQAGFSLEKAFFSRDFHERRAHQKELFYRLPARPLAKFLLLYIGKRGFLDGRAGFNYAVLQSLYEYMIVLKTRELLKSGTADNVRSAAMVAAKDR